MLLSAVLASIVMMYVAMGVTTVTSSQFNANDASRIATQTLQYADIKANELRNVAYSTIPTRAETRTPIPSTKFDREVIIGPETDLGGGSKQTIATVNVYKQGESQPRQSLAVPLSSQGSGNSVPVGTIIWYPALTPPDGWLECNGQSTTGHPELAVLVGSFVPDLRGVFVRGLDKGRGLDFGRNLGSYQADTIISHEHFLFNRSVPYAVAYSIGVNSTNYATGGAANGDDAYFIQGSNSIPNSGRSSSFGDTETKPKNIALLPCIKY